ncbi:MAG: ATP-binding protein [Verrucomicrobium sp.]
MNWFTMVWSLGVGACLTLGLMHLAIWCRTIRGWVHLSYFVATLGVVGLAACEMGTIKATSPEMMAFSVKMAQVASAVFTVGCLSFVHLHFGTGNRGLLAVALGARALAVVLNFVTGSSLHFLSVESLEYGTLLGERAAMVGVAVPNPWLPAAPLAALMFMVYVADASIRLWRRGPGEGRARALFVGGSLVFFAIMASAQPALVAMQAVKMPFFISLPFMAMVLAMGYELSVDVLRTSQIGEELRESRERLALAAAAAHLALWEWNIPVDRIWISESGTHLYGISPPDIFTIGRFEESIHSADRGMVMTALRKAIDGPDGYAAEYRVVVPGQPIRWIAASGQVQRDGRGKAQLLRGISIDVSALKHAELESARQRNDLAHLSRVATLGELSGSLDHELNQPLAIVLSNAQAAQRLLAQEKPDLAEVKDILNDIISEDRRAGEVIKRLRALLKHGEAKLQLIGLEALTREVMALMRSDLVERGVSVAVDFSCEVPPVLGDPVQIQQVLLNLMLNGCDAMIANRDHERPLHLSARLVDGFVRITIQDQGAGLPENHGEKIFEPFYTTKTEGLGMGLAICRSIVTAHGGRLTAEPGPVRGTLFHMDLPVTASHRV